MKYNQWTLALASAGVVSLNAIANADEHMANNLLNHVSKTTISGYVDTSAIWAIGEGGNANFPGRTNDGEGYVDGFNLNVVQLSLASPLDESDWAAGYQVDLWLGPDSKWLASNTFGGDNADLGIKQAYVHLRAPVGNGLELKMGHFDTIIGYEVGSSPSNPNFSRSYGFFIEPFQHTGLLATYPLTEELSFSAGIANSYGFGINDRAGSESQKTYMASMAYELPESAGSMAGTAVYLGFVDGLVTGDEGADKTSYFAGVTVPTPMEGLSLGAAFDYAQDTTLNQLAFGPGQLTALPTVARYLSEHVADYLESEHVVDHLDKHVADYLDNNAEAFAEEGLTEEEIRMRGESERLAESNRKGSAEGLAEGTRIYGNRRDVWALAGYLSYQMDAKSVFNARLDYVNVESTVLDEDAQFLSLTGTLAHNMWENVLTRLEVRWDHSLKSDFDSLVGDNSGDAVTVALNAVYQF